MNGLHKKYINNMENLINFNKFVNEEYMYRQSADTKPERHGKSKQYFISALVKRGHDKKKLDKMSIAELGKLHASAKKEK